ncbi:MAG: hypothetical protein ACI9BD_001005 [Candidatus Marinamargulisbacteria bacterium]|jgi:uncharacterized protein YajQ (UPF0234 family)
MADQHSFDIASKLDYQEVDNAVNQALKEVTNRYDLKDADGKIDLNQKDNFIQLAASDEYKLKAIYDILKQKFIKRGLSVKALQGQTIEKGSGEAVRQRFDIQQGISQEKAKVIVKAIKDLKVKVQPQIQGDQVRVVSKKIDELQEVMNALKGKDFGIHVDFINYR